MGIGEVNASSQIFWGGFIIGTAGWLYIIYEILLAKPAKFASEGTHASQKPLKLADYRNVRLGHISHGIHWVTLERQCRVAQPSL